MAQKNDEGRLAALPLASRLFQRNLMSQYGPYGCVLCPAPACGAEKRPGPRPARPSARASGPESGTIRIRHLKTVPHCLAATPFRQQHSTVFPSPIPTFSNRSCSTAAVIRLPASLPIRREPPPSARCSITAHTLTLARTRRATTVAFGLNCYEHLTDSSL